MCWQQALKEATGLTFEVSVPTSYAATIEAMCAAPDQHDGLYPGGRLCHRQQPLRCGSRCGSRAQWLVGLLGAVCCAP